MFATTRKSPRSLLTALVATPMLLLALAACSTGGASSTAPTEASGGNEVSQDEMSAARDAYDLKLAECIRGKGLDVKDPKPGEGIQESSPEINAAGSECMKEIGDPPTAAGTKKTDAEQLDEMIQEVDCLRGKGYEIEDPTIETGFTMPDDVTDADIDACMAS
jgi:hypothetical protein